MVALQHGFEVPEIAGVEIIDEEGLNGLTI